MTDVSPLPVLTRLWFAWVCWFRVLFDGTFAARVFGLREAPRELGPAETEPTAVPAAASRELALEGALQLLSLLQREGRFIDFLQQDIAPFPDAEVGAAARVVHEGCRRALAQHATVVAVRSEAEGSTVGVTPEQVAQVKLVGNVGGAPPYRGVLRHRGWRVDGLKLPTRVGEQDPGVIAPAEVEL